MHGVLLTLYELYFRLSFHQLLEALEDADDNTQMDIFVEPPEDGNDTNCDDLSDDEHEANLNCLGPKMLQTRCEVLKKTEDNTLHTNESALDVEYDSSDEEPLSKYKRVEKKSRKSAKMPVQQMKWSKTKPKFNLNVNCQGKPYSDEAGGAKSPLEFFKLFWTDHLLSHIMLTQTQLYSSQKNVCLGMTMNEMYVFLGGLMLSGYAKYPNKRMFWSSQTDVPQILQNSMRLNRFEQILRSFHLNDNDNIDKDDRLYKLRPLISHLNQSF